MTNRYDTRFLYCGFIYIRWFVLIFHGRIVARQPREKQRAEWGETEIPGDQHPASQLALTNEL